ncbi:MAG: hypothetical protein U1A25_00260 [Candidatus Sungbacteria bacterium]|nr:hypothetical protein [bacterium]MDZ4260076.1 hypothetical protein [Candidatus Sungbacteria bacterium]
MHIIHNQLSRVARMLSFIAFFSYASVAFASISIPIEGIAQHPVRRAIVDLGMITGIFVIILAGSVIVEKILTAKPKLKSKRKK